MFDSLSENLESSENIWIVDRRASWHYRNNYQGLFDVRDVSEVITVRNGKNMETTKLEA
jgi:hypothetical protein